MKNITDTLTPLMDKFRAKTGLTDKLTVARATGLMDSFNLNNLIANSSNEWTKVENVWDVGFPTIAVKRNETYTFTAEVKDNAYPVKVSGVLYNDKWNAIEPNHDEEAPIYKGNISDVYIGNDYRSNGGKLTVTIKIRPSNARFLELRIVSMGKGTITYRNPIAFKENPLTTVGGVTKRLLFSLVPRIGGACYAA